MGTPAVTAPRWLLDSNVVMDWLNSNSGPAFSGHFTRYLEEGAATSVITWMEVLGWRGHSASALTAQLVLVTRNVKDFSTIADLVVRDPHAVVP